MCNLEDPSSGPRPPRGRRHLVLASILACVGGIAALVVVFLYRTELAQLWADATGALRTLPWYLFMLAMILLPLAGFPNSVLMIAASGAYGVTSSLLMAVPALLINQTAGYFISRHLGRPTLDRILARTRLRGLNLDTGSPWTTTLLIRIVPGMPYAVQNYLPGIMGVPFRIFLPASFPPAYAYATLFILMGNEVTNLLDGRIGKGITWILLMAVVLSAARVVARRIQANRKPQPPDGDAASPSREL